MSSKNFKFPFRTVFYYYKQDIALLFQLNGSGLYNHKSKVFPILCSAVGSHNVNMTEEEEEVDMESIMCPLGRLYCLP